MAGSRARGTGALIAALVIGLGLVAAPFVFQMFDRAPSGGDMIDDFRPFMTEAKLREYKGFIAEIRAAEKEARAEIDPAAARNLGLTAAQYRERYPFLADFEQQWPAIDEDMSDMLVTMDESLDNFEAVDSLPPFKLFPFFFVLPGVIIAALALVALRARKRGSAARGLVIAIGVMGLGLIAAPAIFQMFTRAPLGNTMIDDFGPLMTREKVTRIQGYFITIGNGEAQLRNDALPAAAIDAASTPAVAAFNEDWPNINAELSPMVGTMADNLDNFADVDALPPFALFPWFFVAPGVLLIVLAVVIRRRDSKTPQPEETPMKRMQTASATAVVALATVALTVAGSLGAGASVNAKKAKTLKGTFEVEAGECATAETTGSYFRMVNPGGTVKDGPYVPNGDSSCTDKTFTALTPGSDGGLETGVYQAQPEPPFDDAGNGVADAIVAPQKFFGVNFALATNKTDPQTGEATKKPKITVSGKKLKGDLDALGVAYGKQHFNQGAPKPDGSRPGETAGVTGTYNSKTGDYTLDWSSAIVGGPFDGFTGIWHFEGTFEK